MAVMECLSEDDMLRSANVSQVIVDSCGLFGECIRNECVCNDGWEGSLEFDLFEQNETRRGLVCDTNFVILRVLYILNGILVLFALFWHVYKVKRWKLLRPLNLTLLGLSMNLIYSVWRAIEVETRLLTVDLAGSALFMGSDMLIYAGLLFYKQKFIQFHKGKLSDDDSYRRKQMQCLQYLQFCVFFLGIILFIIYVSIPVAPPELQGTLIRFVLVIWLLLLFYVIFVVRFLVSLTIKNICEIIKSHEAEKNDIAITREVVLPRLKAAVPRLGRVNCALLSGALLLALLSVPALFSSTWLRAWKYISPVYMICHVMIQLLIRSWNQLSKRKRKPTKSSHHSEKIKNSFQESFSI